MSLFCPWHFMSCPLQLKAGFSMTPVSHTNKLFDSCPKVQFRYTSVANNLIGKKVYLLILFISFFFGILILGNLKLNQVASILLIEQKKAKVKK